MKPQSHFTFNRQQRSGILFMVLLISGLFYVFFFFDFSKENVLDLNSPEIVALRHEMDSLEKIAREAKKPKLFPFNPNFITDHKGYVLGMSPKEIDRLHAHRKTGKWVNSIEDFQKVTGVSDSLLAVISPAFKFPDWVTNPKPKSIFKNDFFTKKTTAQKMDLNEATAAELQKVHGIGEALSERIIKYREKIGGFSADSQLYDVYGLDTETVQRALNEFTVKTPKKIMKINLNTASASDIATIPGISFELAKRIFEYRILHEKVKNFEELAEIEGLGPRKFQLIQLYLGLE